MPGILANSVSVTMGSGDTAVDNSFTGFLSAEQVTLSTTPTGSSYVWGLSIPSGSTVARSSLSSTSTSSPTFRPDVAGDYVITCTVDSTTTYVLRLNVAQASVTTSLEAIRYAPRTAASVVAPSQGLATFFDDTTNTFGAKASDGSFFDFPSWRRFDVSFGDVSVGATSSSVEILSLPAGGIIHAVRLRHTTAFAGAGITGVTASVGISGDAAKYASAFDVAQVVAGDTFQLSVGPFTEHATAATSVLLTAVATGATLAALTAGALQAHALISVAR